MSQRVVVFIDAQNVYEGARETFFATLQSDGRYRVVGSRTLGQVSPLKLGQLIASKKPFGYEGENRVLKEVRVYTGRAAAKDSKTYAANRRQFAAWEKDGIVVKARTLRYPHDWPKSRAEEKGVDVALAVDLVVMAVENEYDTGVVVSTDTDMLAAIEHAVTRPGITIEAAAWRNGSRKELSMTDGSHLWCHRLFKADYDSVADYRDYNVASRS